MKLKRLLSVVTAVVMLLSLISVPVFATPEMPGTLEYSAIPVEYESDASLSNGFGTIMGVDGCCFELDLEGITPTQEFFDPPVYTVNAGQTVEVNVTAVIEDSWGEGPATYYNNYEECVEAYNDGNPFEDAWLFSDLEWGVASSTESPAVTLSETNDDGLKLFLTAEEAGYAIVVIRDHSGDPSGTPLLVKVVDDSIAKIGKVGYASVADAIAAAQDGDVIRVIADTTENLNYGNTSDYLKNKTVTLTGNSTITGAAGNYTLYFGDFDNGNRAETDTLNMSGLTFNKVGGNYAVLFDGLSTAMTDVTINSNGNSSLSFANGSQAVLTNVTVANTGYNKGTTRTWRDAALSVQGIGTGPSMLTIKSGTYTSEHGYAIYIFSSGGIVNIEDGTFSGSLMADIDRNSYHEDYNRSMIYISGGTFTNCSFGVPNKANAVGYAGYVITGGTFDANPTAWVADGYEATDNGNGTWTVGKKPVAQIGSVKYTTIAEAIAAANAMENATVTLLRDYDMEANEPGYGWTTSYVAQGETLPRDNMIDLSGKGLTFDLNGHTISNIYNNVFHVTGTDVRICNGEMVIGQLYYGSYSNGKVTLYAAPRYASYPVYVEGASNLVIDDMTTTGGINIAASTATINDLHFTGTSYYAILSQENSVVTINGGTYDKATPGDANYLFWVENGSVMNLTGGTFLKGSAKFKNGINPVITGGVFDFDPSNLGVVDGYEAVQIAENRWQVGKVTAGNFEVTAPVDPTYDLAYTVTKQVLDANEIPINEGTGTQRQVNVKIVTDDTAAEETTVAAEENAEEIIDNLKMDEVLATVVAAVDDAADNIDVSLQIVRDKPDYDAVEEKITYDVHPEAVITVGDSETVVEISNDALETGATFTITLPVPAELAGNEYLKVTHRSVDYDDEVLLLPRLGTPGNYYVQFEVSHFSEFDLEPNDLPLFAGHNISLNGYIDLNFYLNLAENQVTTGTGTVVHFAWAGKTTSYQVQPGDFVAGRGYRTTIQLPAAEMSYSVTATVDINGVAQADVDVYSVREYALSILQQKENYPEKLINLVNAMLDYGAKAQTAFGRTDVVLANDGIDYTMPNISRGALIGYIDDAIWDANNGDTANNMEAVAYEIGADGYYSSSLIYLSGCTLRHYFTSMNLDISLFDGRKSGYYYYVDMPNIAAAELDTLQVFHVGETTFRYSALDYVKAIIWNYSSGDNYDLAAATYWYNQAANAYFD